MEFWVLQIEIFWKYTIFRNWTTSEIWWFSKLQNLGNFWNSEIEIVWNFRNWKFLEFLKLEIFGIIQIANFRNFQNYKFSKFPKLQIFRFFQTTNFFNFPNCKYLEFSKLQILEISEIENFWSYPNCKIKKFLEFFQFEKPKLGTKNWQFRNFSSFANFILPILIIGLRYKSIFSIFISYFSDLISVSSTVLHLNVR